MTELFGLFKSPEFYAAMIALLGVFRGLGEMFEALGNMGQQAGKENWLDSAGAFFRSLSQGFGKILNFLGLGSKQRK